MKKFSPVLLSIFILTLEISNIQVIKAENSLEDQFYSGNWYEKLHWWKKAKPKYDEVVLLISQLKKLQNSLIKQHKELIPKYNNFFKFLEIQKSEEFISKVESLINEISTEIENLPETNSLKTNSLKANSKDAESKEELESLVQIKKTLEEIKTNFEIIVTIKIRLDEAVLEVLDKQIKIAENYEEKALDSFVEIEDVLDDKKARYLYEIIENSAENILQIKNYIQNDLKSYISESTIRFEQLISKVKFSVEQLEKDDIILRPEVKKTIESQKKKQKQKQQVKKPEAPKSWFQTIWSAIKFPFSYLYNLFA